MPELPEVETVRRTLAVATAGKRIVGGTLWRDDVWGGDWSWKTLETAWVGQRLGEAVRRGKQLGLVCEADCEPTTESSGGREHSPRLAGGAVAVHLGMSGRLCVYERGAALPRHTHWSLDFSDGTRLALTDPRRFGGLWGYASVEDLEAKRWAALGNDALLIGPARLQRGLSRTRRALKAALLDQAVVAGLGNIYVDELLFTVKLSPWTPGSEVGRRDCERLVRGMRTLLGRAIAAGGTTLRDYVDASGRAGGFALRHRAYGRAGLRCVRCQSVLRSALLAQRTTVWCERCQVRSVGEGELLKKKEVI